jgi:hypothetical protein
MKRMRMRMRRRKIGKQREEEMTNTMRSTSATFHFHKCSALIVSLLLVFVLHDHSICGIRLSQQIASQHERERRNAPSDSRNGLQN